MRKTPRCAGSCRSIWTQVRSSGTQRPILVLWGGSQAPQICPLSSPCSPNLLWRIARWWLQPAGLLPLLLRFVLFCYFVKAWLCRQASLLGRMGWMPWACPATSEGRLWQPVLWLLASLQPGAPLRGCHLQLILTPQPQLQCGPRVSSPVLAVQLPSSAVWWTAILQAPLSTRLWDSSSPAHSCPELPTIPLNKRRGKWTTNLTFPWVAQMLTPERRLLLRIIFWLVLHRCQCDQRL